MYKYEIDQTEWYIHSAFRNVSDVAVSLILQMSYCRPYFVQNMSIWSLRKFRKELEKAELRRMLQHKHTDLLFDLWV
jgi:hypothetical protein